MDFSVLNRVKSQYQKQSLKILLLDVDGNVEYSNKILLSLHSLGQLHVACNTMFKVSKHRLQFSHTGINIISMADIPNINFDVLITPFFEIKGMGSLIKMFKFLAINVVRGSKFILNDYSTSDGFWYFIKSNAKPIQKKQQNKPLLEPIPTIDRTLKENDTRQDDAKIQKQIEKTSYDQLLENYPIQHFQYDKYQMNYLYQQEPGLVSIIMIVDDQKDPFPQTIRNILHQNIQKLQLILVDNATQFRNNFKVNIRLGEKMPAKYCQNIAKEMSKGQYIITLHSNSKEINVAQKLSKGSYETR